MNQNYFMNFWDHLKKKEEFHSLAFFRFGLGIVMMVEISRFYLHGFIENLFVKQDFHFKYSYFQWVEAPSGNNTYLLFFVSSSLLFLLPSDFLSNCFNLIIYILYLFFLIDEAYYNNHFTYRNRSFLIILSLLENSGPLIVI